MHKYISITLFSGLAFIANVALATPEHLKVKANVAQESQSNQDNINYNDPNMKNSTTNPKLYKKPKNNLKTNRPDKTTKSNSSKSNQNGSQKSPGAPNNTERVF